MTFAPAITSDQFERVRGTSSIASRFVSRIRLNTTPNRIVFQALINQTVFGDSFASVTFDTVTIGAYTDIIADMTVYIGSTSDLSKATFVGRARKNGAGVVATSTVLNINENSFDIQNNWVLTVTEDFRIWDRLNRRVSDVDYEDWDTSFHQLLPIINDLKTSYAGDVDPDTGEMELTLSPSLFVTTSGATAGTPTWDIQDCSYTSGNSHTSSITISVPEGHRFIHLSWPDSGSRTQVRHIEIHACGDTYTYQLMTVESLTFNHPVGTGRDGSLTNYVVPAGLLDLTQVTVWSDDSDQVDDGSISGDNIIFIGRIRTRQNDSAASEQYGIEKTAAYTLEGALTQLARTEQLPYEMLNFIGTPTVFGQIVNMTLWRGIVYVISHSTFLNLHSLSFDDITNTYIAPTRNPSGDILTAVNDLALSINAALQINGAGQSEVVRNGVMLETTSQRNALVSRATVTTSDLISISIKQDGARPVGKVTASGGSYNTSTDQYATSENIAPGIAQAEGSESRTLDRQVFAVNISKAQLDADLNTRATHALEKSQQVDTITATFTPQWHSLLIPSLNTWWKFDVEADVTVDGAVISTAVLTTATRWLLTEASLNYNADGIPEVKGTFIKETFGVTKGYTVNYPPGEVNNTPTVPPIYSVPMFPIPPVSLPTLPPVMPPGSTTITLPLDGNAWAVMGDLDGAQRLLITTTMLVRSVPITRDITPTDLTATEVGKDIKINPFGGFKGLYALYYDTALETSCIRYTEDYLAAPVVWNKGADVVGQFTEMRLGNAAGKVAILGVQVATGTPAAVFDVVDGSHGTITDRDDTTITADAQLIGSVYYIILATAGDDICSGWVGLDASAAYTAYYNECGEAFNTATPHPLDHLGHCVRMVEITSSTPITVTFTFAYAEDCGGAGLITAVTTYSTDYGATLSTPEPIGTTATWFDSQKDGTYLLASTGTQTRKANGSGAYSDYGSAKSSLAGVVPRWHLTTTSSNSGANPQHLIFDDALDSGESMWVVSSNGTVFDAVSPDDGTDTGLATGARCLAVQWSSSGLNSHILAIALFDTTVKLAVSINRGSTWHVSAALDDEAKQPVTLKGDIQKKLVGFIDGSYVGICRNYQATTPVIVHKTFALDNIISIDAAG